MDSGVHSKRLESYMRKLLTAACSIAFAAGLVLAQAQEGPKAEAQDAGHDLKQAGKDTGDAAKHTGKAIKKGTKKGAHKTAKKTKEGAQKLEDKTK